MKTDYIYSDKKDAWTKYAELCDLHAELDSPHYITLTLADNGKEWVVGIHYRTSDKQEE